MNLISNAGSFSAGFSFPLSIYPENIKQPSLYQIAERTPNLNQSIVNQIAEQLALTFTNEKEDREGSFAPIDLLDYIYAVLHSPTYRTKYKEFLKIDFPRVPYPKDRETFWKLVGLGGELRQIHLLESPVVEKFITTYPNDGSNQVIKLTYEDRKGRTLSFDDIMHYQKIIVALTETDRIMKKIDGIEVE